MSGTTGTIPLQDVIDDQLITPALWNGEFGNVSSLMDAAGCGGHSGTDADTQIQTAPYPGSVLSKATSIAGELERLRYQLAAILGEDYWYKTPATDLASVGDVLVPLGGVIDFPVVTAPSTSWHLADGTAISRAGYPALFALIGVTFGAGDSVSTFNLPDYRDRMSIGAGTSYVAGATGGATTRTPVDSGHTHTSAAHDHTMGNHTHSTPAHTHTLATNSVRRPNKSVVNGNAITTADDGVLQSSSVITGNIADAVTNQTASGGSGTSGTPSSNSTDITTPGATGSGTANIGSINILNPYLGMYKMIRVL